MICELYTSYPPTVNNYYVKTQRGIFISQKGKKFRAEVLKDVLEQLNGMPPITGRIRVELKESYYAMAKKNLLSLIESKGQKSIFDVV